ncbi:hypothetical protein [Leifsonia sp. Leaf264]|uniref:hypothetical protein n=1 Tax=Leifsonia sp. Leaf264 TaxID=1736314 RepID=UPI00070009D3|nr:hypothetical protein [Leifsonia sp. Leaf264]KQO98508.1 hypothetical protein ASF30_10625 [Leifsonia sp. Leaf264]
MITFTGTTATIEQLAPLIGQVLTVKVTDAIQGTTVAAGVVASLELRDLSPHPEDRTQGRIYFAGGGHIGWKRSNEIVITLPDDMTWKPAPAAEKDEPDNDKITSTFYVRYTTEGTIVTTDPTATGVTYSDMPSPLKALSHQVGRNLKRGDIEDGGQLVTPHATWEVWHVPTNATAHTDKPATADNTITLYAQYTEEGTVVTADPTEPGITYERNLGAVRAIRKHLNDLPGDDIYSSGMYTLLGEEWMVWHVTV